MSNPIKLTCVEHGIIIINGHNIVEVRREDDQTIIFMAHGFNYYTVKESLEEIEDLMLRDQFAISAMTATQSSAYENHDWKTYDDVAEEAYSQADAMLKARKEIAE